MQKLLDISDTFVQPNWACAFIFELRKDKHERFYVRILNKNQPYTDSIKFEPVAIKGES